MESKEHLVGFVAGGRAKWGVNLGGAPVWTGHFIFFVNFLGGTPTRFLVVFVCVQTWVVPRSHAKFYCSFGIILLWRSSRETNHAIRTTMPSPFLCLQLWQALLANPSKALRIWPQRRVAFSGIVLEVYLNYKLCLFLIVTVCCLQDKALGGQGQCQSRRRSRQKQAFGPLFF